MRTQPNFGLRCFISTMAAMRCAEGPFGPGFRLRHEEENSRRYFRWTNAMWNLNSVAGLRLADSFGMRCGLTKRVVSPTSGIPSFLHHAIDTLKHRQFAQHSVETLD